MVGGFFLRSIRKGANSANIDAERLPVAEIAGHGLVGMWMNHRRAIGAGIDARFAAHTPLWVCNHGLGFRNSLPGAGRADFDAGGIGAVLADNGHIDRNLSPFFDLDTGKRRGGGAFVREAADHFTGLAACTEIRQDRD
jgi:hypothetical protein